MKTECKIGKLTEGNEYIFRVMSENSHGRSKPVESQGIVAKDRFREYNFIIILINIELSVTNSF